MLLQCQCSSMLHLVCASREAVALAMKSSSVLASACGHWAGSHVDCCPQIGPLVRERLQACGLQNSQGSCGVWDDSLYASSTGLQPPSLMLMTYPLFLRCYLMVGCAFFSSCCCPLLTCSSRRPEGFMGPAIMESCFVCAKVKKECWNDLAVAKVGWPHLVPGLASLPYYCCSAGRSSCPTGTVAALSDAEARDWCMAVI